MKKIIEKVEDTLSCFFNKNIKLKLYTPKSGEFICGPNPRQLFINNKPVNIFRSSDDFNFLDEKKSYDDFILLLLNQIKNK